jgi:pimeloyl-ACP methyl ester carboxylesterase
MTPTATTGTLDVPDGTLYFEVRGAGPLIALVGAPMGAAAFAPLADLLAADHAVLTTDPRGIGASPLHDVEHESVPLDRADDLARLIEHVTARVGGVDDGQAEVLGSSGGAVTVLALAATRPDLVRTVVAHEPPLDTLLPDRAALVAGAAAMRDAYAAGDPLGAWQRFVADAHLDVPAEMMVAQDPQAVCDERRWFLHELVGTVEFEPDLDALRSGGVAIVAGIGEASAGQLCDRATRLLAEHLGIAPTMFPGGHTGFAEQPPAFHARLREVLAGRS